MMTMTRTEIENLLDPSDRHDLVVSVYADMTIKDGFHRDIDRHLKNQARTAADLLARAGARKDLDANLVAIREILAEHAGIAARGLAIFSACSRGLREALPLEFPVQNRLVIDGEPYLLPLLEHWFADPSYLVVLLDSSRANLISAYHGPAERVDEIRRTEAEEPVQRDKPRLTYKKRLAHTRHERLHATDDDRFLREIVDHVDVHWGRGPYTGLLLLGQPSITSALRRRLPRHLEPAVAAEIPHAMTDRVEDLTGDIARAAEDWRRARESGLLTELRERWKENHLVADGPIEVLDSLQQGRASQIIVGTRRELPGARCVECGYRFGEASQTCAYCHGRCRAINAVQEILRMAIRHRVPLYLFSTQAAEDPLIGVGGVSAFLKAGANWA